MVSIAVPVNYCNVVKLIALANSFITLQVR